MKKVLASSVVVLMVLLLSAGLGLAGNGKGGGIGGGGTGSSLVCSGVPMTIEGTVSDASYPGSGLQIDTGSEVVTVYGIGPYRYWENSEIARPAIGDGVIVDGMEVAFSDESIKIIAMGITVNGDELQLREECDGDGVGGWPLWRGGSGNSN